MTFSTQPVQQNQQGDFKKPTAPASKKRSVNASEETSKLEKKQKIAPLCEKYPPQDISDSMQTNMIASQIFKDIDRLKVEKELKAIPSKEDQTPFTLRMASAKPYLALSYLKEGVPTHELIAYNGEMNDGKGGFYTDISEIQAPDIETLLKKINHKILRALSRLQTNFAIKTIELGQEHKHLWKWADQWQNEKIIKFQNGEFGCHLGKTSQCLPKQYWEPEIDSYSIVNENVDFEGQAFEEKDCKWTAQAKKVIFENCFFKHLNGIETFLKHFPELEILEIVDSYLDVDSTTTRIFNPDTCPKILDDIMQQVQEMYAVKNHPTLKEIHFTDISTSFRVKNSLQNKATIPCTDNKVFKITLKKSQGVGETQREL